MSFQDQYKEYKERQEAKRYFRSQNDQFLKTDQWVKCILGGFVCAVICGLVMGLLIYTIRITSLLFYIVCGYVIANAITSLANVHSFQTAVLSVVFTFICFVVGEMVWALVPLYQMGMPISLTVVLRLIIPSLQGLFVGDLFTTLMALCGLYIAYQQAQ